jgi:thiol-disulfide isomerase/thioredoxin
VDSAERDGTTSPAKPVKGKKGTASLKVVGPQELFAVVRESKQKGVLINFWATWCGPCREELPMLAKVAKAYQERGIKILPVSVDSAEGQPQIADVLSGFGFEAPYYVVKEPMSAMKAAMYDGWPGNIPASFLLDGNAQRRYYFNTEIYENELVPKLDAFLAGTLAEGQSNHPTAPGATPQ